MVVIVVALVTACDKVSTDKNKGNEDSLFLGFTFGMERKAFFTYCWDMNKKGLFTHSPTNAAVEYKLKRELNAPVLMRFYPAFHEDKIYEMPVVFMYEAWAPWNQQYSSDTLFVKLLPLFKKWYGEEFKSEDHPTMGKVYYRFDGKRRINLFKRDEQFVQAVFTDMQVKQVVKEIQDRERLDAQKQNQ
jgi:hypothetical protein